MIRKLLVISVIIIIVLPIFSGFALAQDTVVYIGAIIEKSTISEGPGSGFEIIADLEILDEVIVLMPGNIWHTVLFNGSKGYVRAEHVGELFFSRMDPEKLLFAQKPSPIIAEPIESKSESPYYIIVDKEKQLTTVLIRGDSGDYDTIYLQMLSSTGRTPGRTPLGVFKITSRKLDWLYSAGYKVFMQNDVQFNNRIYFHSPAYNRSEKNAMVVQTYYDLGEPVSAGCVRLTTADSVWIRENCPVGTRVKVIKSGGPHVVEINIIPYLPSGQTYDPTETELQIAWINRKGYDGNNYRFKFLMD